MKATNQLLPVYRNFCCKTTFVRPDRQPSRADFQWPICLIALFFFIGASMLEYLVEVQTPCEFLLVCLVFVTRRLGQLFVATAQQNDTSLMFTTMKALWQRFLAARRWFKRGQPLFRRLNETGLSSVPSRCSSGVAATSACFCCLPQQTLNPSLFLIAIFKLIYFFHRIIELLGNAFTRIFCKLLKDSRLFTEQCLNRSYCDGNLW